MSDKSLKLVKDCTRALDRLCEYHGCNNIQILLMLLAGYTELSPGESINYTGPEGLEFTMSNKGVLS